MNVKAPFAEFLGTAILTAAVIGSGIMAINLTDDMLVALLANALATLFVLAVLIFVFSPISGSHFNPAVTLSLAFTNQFPKKDILSFVLVQIAGAISGAFVANAMFGQAVVQISTHERLELGTFLGEIVATAFLIFVILALLATNRANQIPLAVPLVIGGGYFFTSSTSFANPAVTIGRIFSDTFAGIAPVSALGFMLAQLVGAVLAVVAARYLFPVIKSAKTS